MSTIVSEPDTRSTFHTGASQQLRTRMAAARLSFRWLGVRKSLSSAQKNQAADTFGAEGKFLSAGKKLLDTSHPAYKAVNAIRSQAVQHWKEVSLPFPEPGIRLIRQDQMGDFDQRMHGYQDQLTTAVAVLDDHYTDLRRAARQRLGDLFDASDYPATLIGLFDLEHDYPSVEPPDYLRDLNPELYQRECERVQTRFDQAVELAEQAFFDELSELVSHLSERLSGQDDGKPKVFRDSAVTNLTQFFERFRSLNVRSNQQLDQLVEQAQQIVSGVRPQQLRDNSELRQQLATEMSGVQANLGQLLVDRPRRNILRRPR